MRQQLRQPDGGPNKRATLIKYLLKKESLKTALSLTEKGQEAARQMKSAPHKKGKTAYFNSRGRCRWEKIKTKRMMMSENQSSQLLVHVMAFQGTEG
jgi:hypothetical protein